MNEQPEGNSNSDVFHEDERSKTQETGENVVNRGEKCEQNPSQNESHIDTSLSLVELNQLGSSHLQQFIRFGVVQDINTVIECYTRALDLTPDGDPKTPDRLMWLGGAHNWRFQRLGEMKDLDRSMEYKSRALELTPDGHSGLPIRHASLGVSYGERFRRLGELHDLEKVVEYFTRALELTPDGHSDLLQRHAELGVSYTDRFRRLGELQDLEKVVEYFTRALELTPDGHRDLPERHASLGVCYTDRFQLLGEFQDLEEAIEHHARALELTPDGHSDLSRRHAELGLSYNHRFQRLGELHDLEKAVEYKSRALELTPDGHSDLPRRYASLGVSYSDRFQRLGELQDLEKAIEHHARALELTPDGHSDLSRRHAELGGSYTDRFQRLGELHDLEKAVEHHTRALKLTPDDHSDLPMRYAELGLSYSHRFRCLGKPHDLEKAIEYNTRAFKLTPDGHPDLPWLQFNQAHTYFLRYQLTSDPSHLSYAWNLMRKATQLSAGIPRRIFQNAPEWAKLASTNSSLKPIEAYKTTIDLIHHFIPLGVATSQRFQDLSNVGNLATYAACTAVLRSDYQQAIEWLEHGRCVVWNRSLMLGSPLDQLHHSHPDLAGRLKSITGQLRDTGHSFAPSDSLSPDRVDLEEVDRQRRRLVTEYRELLTQVRSIPEFEDFLQPVMSSGLTRAARYGPIVAINCHTSRCDACIILPGQVDVKHLKLDFTSKEAQRAWSELESSLKGPGLRQRGVQRRRPAEVKAIFASVLKKLWIHIVQPVLDFLGLMNDLPTGNLPHITWCPTGALSFLPLHAAGDYDQPRARVFNYVISSYTPTLSALLTSASETGSSNAIPRVLAIGQANTHGCNPLPGTAKELAFVKAHTENTAQYSELVGRDATTKDVLDAMEQHDWVHLACHAHQNVSDPNKSGFFLEDGTLDLASINRRAFKNKGLAFLSACETARGDERLPDEAVHLASGMLMAGYPSVIATMWSVFDDDAPVVADKVYGKLLKDGKLGNGEAGKALQYAVAALRDQVGEEKFARWVPFIHIGS